MLARHLVALGLVALQFALLSPTALAQQQHPAQTVNVTNGQQFADACAAFGRSNADLTVILPADGTIISLVNSTVQRVGDAQAVGGKAFYDGQLTVLGQGGVLDAGMRADLVPAPPGSSRHVTFQDVSIINVCAGNNIHFSTGVLSAVQTMMGLLSSEPMRKGTSYQNARVYARQSEIAFLVYLTHVQRTTWAAVRQRYLRQLDTYNLFRPLVAHCSSRTLRMAMVSTGGWEGRELTFRSTDSDKDVLVRAMRENGTLLPLRWCANQTLVPEEIATAPYDVQWGPMAPFEAAMPDLADGVAWAVRQDAAQLPVPMLLVHTTRVDLSEDSLDTTLQLTAPLQILGPIHDQTRPGDQPTPPPILDLGGRVAPLFELTGRGQLFMRQLVLDGLEARPLGKALPRGPLSALPFTSLANLTNSSSSATSAAPDAWRGDAPIQLHNVTVVLPVQDYLALLMLATDGIGGMSVRGCMDAQTLQLAAQLNNSISQITLSLLARQAGTIVSLWQVLPVDAYTAFGVNATESAFQPATAISVQLVAACAKAMQPSAGAPDLRSGDSGGGSGASLAIRCSIGGAFLLVMLGVLAGVAVHLQRQKRREAATLATADKSDKGADADAAGGCSPGMVALTVSTATFPDPGSSHVADGKGTFTTCSSTSRRAAMTTGSCTAAGTHTAGTGSTAQGHLQQSLRAGGGAGSEAGAGAGAVVSLLQQAERRLLRHVDVQALAAAGASNTTDGSAGNPGTGGEMVMRAASASTSAHAKSRGETKNGSGDAGARSMEEAAAADHTAPVGEHAGGAPASVLRHVHELLLSSLHNNKNNNGGGGGGEKRGKRPKASAKSPRWLDASAADVKGGGGGGGAVAGQALGAVSHASRSASASLSHPLELVKEVTESNSVLLAASRTANKVVIHDVLGQGASGTVYIGAWRGLPVAIKTMVYDGSAGHELTPAVMETAISASLGHRHVVATYHYDIKRVAHQACEADEAGLQVTYKHRRLEVQDEHGVDAGTFKVFLIQELCQSSLHMILSQGALFDPKCSQLVNQVLMYSILLHIATGLEYLHVLNIMHGDLTPSNVLLKLDDSEPCGMVAKLADFGLSRRLDQQATHVSNFGAGTPFYVAPEVVNERRASPAADIYSFGVLMWQMLAGICPYVSGADGSFCANPAFPVIPAEARVPESVQLLMFRCLQQDPRVRPTATELRAALQAQVMVS